jgi:molecular chaperone GrpE
MALRLLDVIDQLEVALAPEAATGVDAAWVEGVRAILRNFLHAVQQEGFERFDAEGEQFDPSRHEALMSTPTTEHSPGKVIRQLAAGYTHKGEVVRPARVEIAAPPPDDADGE